MKRETVGMLTGVVVAGIGAALWTARPPAAESASSSTVELRQVDVGYAVGRPGLKARLTVATGEALEYEVADPRAAEVFLGLTELFMSGRARMFAEVDGREVRGVHVSGPSSRGAP